jgi:hypothetical protein
MSGNRFQLACHSGALTFRELKVGNASVSGLARLNGRPVRAAARTEEGSIVLRFARPLTLKPGDTCVVE